MFMANQTTVCWGPHGQMILTALCVIMLLK